MKLRGILKFNFSPIALNGNYKLPKWLKCEVVDGIIYIWGTPKFRDDINFTVRIINEMEFTVKSYKIIENIKKREE